MFTKYRLMNAAGGLGDAGTDDGGSGGTGDSGSGAGDGGAGTPPEYVGPEWAKAWEGVNDLGAEVLNDPSLKVFNSPTALLKSYVHGVKQMGKKGVNIPDQNSSKEEWDQFYQKTGVPLEDVKYKEAVKLATGDANKLGEEFNTGFLKLAHESRVKPDQAQKLYEYFNSQVNDGATKQIAANATKTQADLDALQAEWGEEAYGVKINKATSFLKEHAGEEFIQYLGTTGLGKNTQLIKAFAAMADKVLGESEIPKGDPSHGMTINDLEKEINATMMDFDGAYYNKNHADHERKVNEVLAMNRKLDKARGQK